jgi:hypothetical protein
MSGVTGQQLYDELAAAANAAGVSLRHFVAPLFNEPSWKLEQLRIAKVPMPATIARVRALIAGEPLPPTRTSPVKGKTISRRHERITGGETRLSGEVIAYRRNLTDMAHAERLPGETLAAAVRRISHQQRTIAELGGAA